ncbi:MAG: hypothetical protein U0O25_00600 [Succinivibrio sp.]|uniref:Uncharacterized protein n=1 Tax=Succinivibrio faecicola TaxID=2820300 RepID=A0ABS7DFT2_9GAMM|nr:MULTISPECIES: hypothetical protein [Succinivibrio]MBQ2381285.1 hypothetical protein [Succinivibrio sp.]MBW7570150.1 hypothetical protein [Succinivibrio faecicola]MCI6939397.1 hypothetical protein [Succinatimonas hippei]MDD6206569.1 hypothetical protein [Succinivibrio sp.]
MKKSNRLLRNNTTAKRSRLRQQFIHSSRMHRQARHKVFFIQENPQN